VVEIVPRAYCSDALENGSNNDFARYGYLIPARVAAPGAINFKVVAADVLTVSLVSPHAFIRSGTADFKAFV